MENPTYLRHRICANLISLIKLQEWLVLPTAESRTGLELSLCLILLLRFFCPGSHMAFPVMQLQSPMEQGEVSFESLVSGLSRPLWHSLEYKCTRWWTCPHKLNLAFIFNPQMLFQQVFVSLLAGQLPSLKMLWGHHITLKKIPVYAQSPAWHGSCLLSHICLASLVHSVSTNWPSFIFHKCKIFLSASGPSNCSSVCWNIPSHSAFWAKIGSHFSREVVSDLPDQHGCPFIYLILLSTNTKAKNLSLF